MTPAEMSAHLRVVCQKAPVIPVLVIEDASSAADLARAPIGFTRSRKDLDDSEAIKSRPSTAYHRCCADRPAPAPRP